MNDHSILRHRRVLVAVALIAIAAALLALAPRAAAGVYRAVQCHAQLGAGRADALFHSSSGRYTGRADCDGEGLTVTHTPGRERTRAGRFGAWTLSAPPGAAIVRVAVRAGAADADGHSPELAVAVTDGARRIVAGVRGRPHTVRWSGDGGRALTARLRCARRRECGAGRAAHIRVRNLSLLLRDAIRPAVTAAGQLLAPGARRGLQALEVRARDAGAGVRAITVEVNDDPVAVRVLGCRLAGLVALRLRPCPVAPTEPFGVLTTTPHFHQGPNLIRVCALDYAPRATANRGCAARTVRIDNLCPLATRPGAVLHARFKGGGTTQTTRSDRPATLVGRLTGATGAPVAGAEVCIATRTRGERTTETVLATPVTDPQGGFRVRIPPGPSRAVRIAHWPNADRAIERFLTLRSRAIPRLRLRPRRTLRNGERLRFSVRIPGPASGGRRVQVEARASGRWVEVAGGRTSRAGIWRGRYRFRSTTGTRRYAFRAVVPRQAGYPYERGRSRVVRQRVVGERS